MNTFESFNKSVFNHYSIPKDCKALLKPAKWFDRSLMLNFGEGLVAKITVDDLGCKDHFNCFQVKIINKAEGTVDQKTFRFKDYIIFEQSNHAGSNYYHAWHDRGELKWYICRPTDVKPIVKAICDYINLFK